MVLLGLVLCQDARAFYNPSTGRWLSRDPHIEFGFNAICTTPQTKFPCYSPQQCGHSCSESKADKDRLQVGSDELNPYAFVKNTPIHAMDYLGLVGRVCVEKCCSSSTVTGQFKTSQSGSLQNRPL